MKKTTNHLTFIDLFAGIGGIRLAFEACGCKCIFTSEWDKYSQQTYSANFNDQPRGDITKIVEHEIPSFDILTAGFPCQPFSSIGLRQGFAHKTQGTLFYDVARILAHHRPKAFLLENVPGLVSHENGRTITTIFDALRDIGYDVWYQILDSADFGLPQTRKRIYIVGLRVDHSRDPILFRPKSDDPSLFQDVKLRNRFSFPLGSNTKTGIGKFLESGVSGHSISKHLQTVYLFKVNDGRPELVDVNSTGVVKPLVASYHKIQRLTGTFVKDGETGIRLLTARECKAIMGFPNEFIIPVSRTQMYRQFGNSVAVPVVQAIGKKIIDAISAENEFINCKTDNGHFNKV